MQVFAPVSVKAEDLDVDDDYGDDDSASEVVDSLSSFRGQVGAQLGFFLARLVNAVAGCVGVCVCLCV